MKGYQHGMAREARRVPEESYAEMDARLKREKASRQAQAITDGLFAPIEPPHNGTETSKAAAAAVASKSEIDRQKVLDSLEANGPQTRPELVETTGLPENAINPRCWELAKLGLIHKDGVRDGRSIVRLGPDPKKQSEAA